MSASACCSPTSIHIPCMVCRRSADGDLHSARDAESRLADALRQADAARAQKLDAQKRADDLARWARCP